MIFKPYKSLKGMAINFLLLFIARVLWMFGEYAHKYRLLGNFGDLHYWKDNTIYRFIYETDNCWFVIVLCWLAGKFSNELIEKYKVLSFAVQCLVLFEIDNTLCIIGFVAKDNSGQSFGETLINICSLIFFFVQIIYFILKPYLIKLKNAIIAWWYLRGKR